MHALEVAEELEKVGIEVVAELHMSTINFLTHNLLMNKEEFSRIK
ncbi:Uncharacterised protein [Acinetobacter baumannii]|nr:Uncharacterised protein [Acinetobacter baumannii]